MDYKKKPSVFFVGSKKPNTSDVPTISLKRLEECRRHADELRSPKRVQQN